MRILHPRFRLWTLYILHNNCPRLPLLLKVYSQRLQKCKSTPSVPPPTIPVVHQPSPEMKPLRSALRNSSRSPSPQLALLPPAIPARSTLRPGPAVPPKASEAANAGDDASSISSYETTREAWDEDDVSTPVQKYATPTLAPAPPPKAVQAQALIAGGSDISQSTNSSTTTGPVRRKSVRMSLPPTFSTTPPALDEVGEDNEPARRYEPWSSSAAVGKAYQRRTWSSRVREERDVWQDSSDEDEDEEYSKAKRLLSKFSRKSR